MSLAKLWNKAWCSLTNSDTELFLWKSNLLQETITARFTLTLPFHSSRKVSYQSKYIP